MNPEGRRRHAVIVRPKVKSLRARQRAAVLAVGLLGAGAALTVRHLRSSLPAWGSLGAGLASRAWTLELAALPEPWRGPAAAAFEPLRGETPGAAAEDLARALGWAKSVIPSRSWLSRRAALVVLPRRAVARLAGGSRVPEFLSDDGTVFAAAASLYPAPLPLLELGSWPEARRAEVAKLVGELSRWEGPPSGLERLRCVSPEEGCSAQFADLTTVLWGDLRWTGEKLSRLRAILADARPQMPGPLTVDLRYFEDGRALLKASAPARARALPARRGGLR